MGLVGFVVKFEIMEGLKDCWMRFGGGMVDKIVCFELIC